MAIGIKCEACKTTFRVNDSLAGKTVKCSKCKSHIKVPPTAGGTTAGRSTQHSASPANSPQQQKAPPKRRVTSKSAPPPKRLKPASARQPSLEQRRAAVLKAFQGEISPVRAPISYRLGILLAAVVMVILPIIYIGLILVTGWIVYWHLTNNVGMLAFGRGRGKLFVLLAYIAPLFGGLTMVLFMIKPLFARPSEDGRTRSLTPQGEPLVFAFVERICAAVRAPVPKRIDVDCQVNASASFRRGWWSVLTGNDLVLTIGMPLVAGFTMRQLAGVLAHEFGHFSQGAGMRLTYIVRTISHWFTRVVYERDEWDDWLRATADGCDNAFGLVIAFGIFCVWLTRKILWVLMMAGHLVSGFLLRQMEFDADRYEARLAGSQTFEATCHRLHEIGMAHSASMSALQDYFAEGKLGNNMPRLVQSKLGELPVELKQAVTTSIQESTTSWLATHPADKDRIANAKREKATGIFQVERPATELFQHYDKLCEGTTWDFYRSVLGPNVKPNDLKPIDDLLAQQDQQKRHRAALDRFFQGTFQSLRPVRWPTTYLAQPETPQERLQALQLARTEMAKLAAGYQATVKQYNEAQMDAAQGLAATKLYQTQIKIPPSMFKFPNQDAAKKAANRANLNSSRLEDFERVVGQRLTAALQLLFVPKVAGKIDDAAAKLAEAQQLIPVAAHLSRQLKNVVEIRDRLGLLSSGLSQYANNSSHEPLINMILGAADDLHKLLNQVGTSLKMVDYPFGHANENIKLSTYLLPTMTVAQDVGGIHSIGEGMLDRFIAIHCRTIGRIVEIVESVEQALKPKS